MLKCIQKTTRDLKIYCVNRQCTVCGKNSFYLFYEDYATSSSLQGRAEIISGLFFLFTISPASKAVFTTSNSKLTSHQSIILPNGKQQFPLCLFLYRQPKFQTLSTWHTSSMLSNLKSIMINPMAQSTSPIQSTP